jgi:isopentenyldiphosphate isomerase
MSKEFIVQCEEDGTVIGPIDRKTAHSTGIKHIICHQVVIGMVYCKTSKRWCLQKKLSKSINVEIWDTSIGGHCCYLDGFKLLSPEKNMRKEAEEELGLTKYNLIPVDGELIKTEYSNEYMFFYVIQVDDENVTHPDGEVLAHLWIDDKDIENFFSTNRISHVLKLAYKKCKAKIFSE